MFIKVWSEYDINGTFGGNNNEEVYQVDDDLETHEIDEIVKNKIVSSTSMPEEELEGLFDWSYINIENLN